MDTNESIKGMRNQFSYSVNINRVNDTAMGDTLLNYRYQLVGMKEEDRLLRSHRDSASPDPNWRKGTGAGHHRLPIRVSLSYKLTKKLRHALEHRYNVSRIRTTVTAIRPTRAPTISARHDIASRLRTASNLMLKNMGPHRNVRSRTRQTAPKRENIPRFCRRSLGI